MNPPRLTGSPLGRFLSSRWLLYGPVLLVASLIGAAVWYGWRHYRSAPPPSASSPPPPLDPLQSSWTGKIRAQKTVLIPAPIDGTLESIEVLDGEEVYEGQLLGRIQNTSLEANRQRALEDLERAKTRAADLESQLLAARLESSRSSAELARLRSEHELGARQFEHLRKLFAEGAAARRSFEAAESSFRKLSADLKDAEEASRAASARAQSLQTSLDQAKQTLADKTAELEDAEAEQLTGEVKAPVAGLLIGHRKNAAEEVTRDIEDLFEIATELSAMEVAAGIPPALAARLKPGASALVQIAEAGPTPLNGKIRAIEMDTAIVEFLNPSPAIRPGMTAQVRFLNEPVPQLGIR
ncbi:MAG: HlyD family secretion protein [Acidobacteriota bacterium]